MIRQKTSLGSYIYKNNHTFVPYRSYANKQMWMVVGFQKTKNKVGESTGEADVKITHYAVVAQNHTEAVEEAIKMYKRNIIPASLPKAKNGNTSKCDSS